MDDGSDVGLDLTGGYYDGIDNETIEFFRKCLFHNFQ